MTSGLNFRPGIDPRRCTGQNGALSGPTREPGDPPPENMKTKMFTMTKRSEPYTARRTLKRFNRVTRDGKLALRAYHEAAHGVLGELFGWPVHMISLVKQGESNARTTAPIDIGDEDEFEKLVEGGDEQDALWETQAYILVLLGGRAAESICLGEGFDAARFERDTLWHNGKPLSLTLLARGGWVQHNDRDKAHLMTLRLRRRRRHLVKSISVHLRESWDLAERVLTEVWPSVVRVGEALLKARPPELRRPRLLRLIRTPAFERLSSHWTSPETPLLGLRKEVVREELTGLLP